MLPYHLFIGLAAESQIELLTETGSFLAERHERLSSSLYYLVGDFYVELRFVSGPPSRILMRAFTHAHPQFDRLLDALPVDVYALFSASA
jgi:hypothetical protein